MKIYLPAIFSLFFIFSACKKTIPVGTSIINPAELSAQLENSHVASGCHAFSKIALSQSDRIKEPKVIKRRMANGSVITNAKRQFGNKPDHTVKILHPVTCKEDDPDDSSLKGKNIIMIVGYGIALIGFIIAAVGVGRLTDEDTTLKSALKTLGLGAAIMIVSIPFILIGEAIEKQKANRKKGTDADQLY